MKDLKSWPQLKDCASVVLENIKCQEYVCIALRGLLDHFLSEHRSQFHPVDIDWLLELASEKVVWEQQHIQVLTDDASDSVPFGVIKHYLLRVLTHEKTLDERSRKEHFAGFNKQAS